MILGVGVGLVFFGGFGGMILLMPGFFRRNSRMKPGLFMSLKRYFDAPVIERGGS